MINESCRLFILNRLGEIQELMNQGKSILDIFNYYQNRYKLKWHDYSAFGVYIRKAGLKFTSENLELIHKNKYIKKSKTMINKSPQEKLATYLKYKHTLDNISKDVKLTYIRKRELTKASYSDEQKQHRIDAMIVTKRKNNSFNSSKSEEMVYEKLKLNFKNMEIIRQYKDTRYPFCCDFYIKDIDLFIELNEFYTHGSHIFDPNNEQDNLSLNTLLSKSQFRINSKGKTVKSSAAAIIDIWTKKDPQKLSFIIKNNLRCILIYPKNIVYYYNINKEQLKEIIYAKST